MQNRERSALGKRWRTFGAATVAAGALLALAPHPSLASAPPGYSVRRASVTSAGAEGIGESRASSISANGRAVVFRSAASDIVANDNNGHPDVFVHDLESGITERVSVSSAGEEGTVPRDEVAPLDPPDSGTSISEEGRLVAFHSSLSGLVAGDMNATSDIFVHDRVTGATTRVSVRSNGGEGNGPSHSPFMSSDGRYVAFQSGASNLVSGDTNLDLDIFVHDRMTGLTDLVSVDSNGIQALGGQSEAPVLSGDGRYVAFKSYAFNLVLGDTNAHFDVFVRDRSHDTTERVSLTSDGSQAFGGGSLYMSISGDGRYVAFESAAINLDLRSINTHMDVFVHDRVTGQTSLASVNDDGTPGDGWSGRPAISVDGRYVAFESIAANLDPADTNFFPDVFVRDLLRGHTDQLSIALDGAAPNGDSAWPAISADGGRVAFESNASDLVSSDSNHIKDVFVASY